MDPGDDIYNYENIDEVDYFNTKHVTIDLIEIESQMTSKRSLLRRIDDNLYDFFIQSSESLLSLLTTYKKCMELLKGFKAETINQNKEFEKVAVSEELAKKLKLFRDDMRIFLTEERYLVTSGYFNENSIFCVMSNDLIFIGEKADRNLFTLKKSIPKATVSMKKNDESITIILDTGDLSLKGDKNIIEDFYEAFKEISYVYNSKNTLFPIEIDFELLKFYIQTGCFDEFIDYFEVNGLRKNEKYSETITNFLDQIEIQDLETLECIMKVRGNPLVICEQFYLKRLKSCLEKINKIQPFESFVSDIFSFLNHFCEQIELFFKENSIPRIESILLIEKCTINSLQFLERRVMINSKVFGNQNTLDILSQHLEFLCLNFKYLVQDTINISFIGTERMINEAKEAIMFNITEFLDS